MTTVSSNPVSSRADGAGTGFRTAPTQRRVWARRIASGVEPFAQLAVQIEGPLDADRLAAAVSAVADRHEALRTRFVPGPGRGLPVQVIDDTAAPLVRATSPAAGPEAICRRERAALDPVAGPAFRALLATGRDGSWLILTGHALVVDPESLRVVSREVVARYEGGARADAEPPLQYADFATWHGELLADAEHAPDRAAWTRYLDQATEAGWRGTAGSGGGDWRSSHATVTGELWSGLNFLATQWEHTTSELLAGLSEVLVWRFAGERPVSVAAVTAARSHPTLREAVGGFERVVPMVCAFDGQLPVRAAVGEAAARRAEWVARIDHLDPAARPGIAAEPWTSFAVEVTEIASPQAADAVTFTPVAENASADAMVRIRFMLGAGRVDIETGYDDARVEAGVAESLTECLLALLAAAVANPEATVTQLGMLPVAQRERAAATGRGPVQDVPDNPVHIGVAEQARRTPDAVAVEAADGELTYARLDGRAARLAARLIELGVRPGDRVVVNIGRTAALPVALLAVLRAGAAFVPVDIEHPSARLAFVLTETAATVLLTERERLDRTDPGGAAMLAVDDESSGSDGLAPADPVRVDMDGLAYVMYTSGTTGAPNGVQLTHAGLANYLSWAARTYRMAEGSGAVVASSIGFDLTLTTLLAPLTTGQRVILVPERAGLNGLVAQLRARTDLTLVKLTPTHLDVLNQLLDPAELTGRVRTLVVGGEALRAESVELFRAGGARVVNEYGPTETVVGSVAYLVGADTPHTGPVPIGSPIANTEVALLDPRRQPVADGMVGEIYLGGAGVAQGYLARPEQTARRFVVLDGGRYYRTGDLARRRPDGILEYLGRADEQVKIRGVRIEPAEIEQVLLDHDTVVRAVVTARTDEDPGGSSPLAGEPMLVAYVVPAPGAAPQPGVLAEFCSNRLPAQLIPAAFMILEALPETANGKLDRAALPRPASRQPEFSAFVAARTATEEILAGAMATVLGVQRVGIDDNYFALGGDSIRSVMVASRAQARGVEVTVADLHRFPTVRQCATHLDGRTAPETVAATEPFELIDPADRERLPAEVQDAFPLNLLQEGMIFHRDFAAKSAVYHAIASVRLRAPLHLEVMRTVIRQLLERHPMLRTSFDMATYSRPLQLVHGEYATPLYHDDLRDLGESEQGARIDEWIDREKQRGFELDEYPLIRFMIHELGPDLFQFTYGFHHEIVDGWSEALMITELFSHYFSLVFDEPIAIRPPTSTMRDAVALELTALEDQRNYEFWDSYLADATLMRLPRMSGGPRADKGDREIVRIAVPVPVELSERLKGLAAARAVPLKSVLMAAHLAVMSAYGGHEDTLTYTVTNGRPETADGSTAIGLFVNSLALRVRMTGGTWRDLIAATLVAEQASLPYRRLPMAELKRHQGNEPLAEALFFFTNYHVFGVLDRWKDRGVEHVADELYGESTFPFCGIFRLNRDTGHLEVRIEYDGLQFSGELMDSVRDCYAQVLAAMAADPDARYDTEPLLSARDRAALERFVAGPRAVPDERCLHELIHEQAVLRPDAVAVQLDGSALTYGELDRRANRLAHALREGGAGPERPVAVLAERSVEQIVCLVGVLASGAAYLPLDPGQPDERIAALLAAVDVTAVVAQRHLRDRLGDRADVLAVDPGLMFCADRPAHPVAAGTVPDNAAYVIFTSGSTGQPKGVVVTHRNVVASLAARTAAYGTDPERFLLLSSFAFDSSVAGIFWTLTRGGTLVLPAEGLQIEPASLAAVVARQRPTHTLAIPSLLAPLFDQAERGWLDSLRTIVAAGEPCPRTLSDTCATAAPSARLANEYGPTEATVWSTVSFAAPGDPTDRTQVPIGTPVAGVRAEVLDPHGRPVPVGVAGELYIGGAGVARGYAGRPAETARAFRPDPAAAGDRRYATGDLGRFLDDGQVEFLGRTDHQVKIRGFRVEPGEIEAVLETHPEVSRAIVTVRGETPSDKALIAYLLPTVQGRPDASELQQYVRDRLPKYMVPTACVVLDSVPLTPTGKVDQRALPQPTRADLAGRREYVAPRTETEQAVAAIWAKVLKVDRVGTADLFFELGGESLRAMQVIAATTRVFGVKLSVRRLFKSPTVADFARVVDEARPVSVEVARS
ncbi:amino acid adenylation domain-containing protein [Nocardia sp. NPDC047038]|uniref:amino acid adenylation domain-containing protein n=1 Tax=Nocardia sp. NPDC047038 TaxID=3154338 RepID=UPI0033EE50A4